MDGLTHDVRGGEAGVGHREPRLSSVLVEASVGAGIRVRVRVRVRIRVRVRVRVAHEANTGWADSVLQIGGAPPRFKWPADRWVPGANGGASPADRRVVADPPRVLVRGCSMVRGCSIVRHRVRLCRHNYTAPVLLLLRLDCY